MQVYVRHWKKVEREKSMEREMERRETGWRRNRKKKEYNCVWIFLQTFLPIAILCRCCNFSLPRCDVQVAFWACLSPILPLSSLFTPILLCVFFWSPHSDIQSLPSVEWYCLFSTHLFYFCFHLWFCYSVLLEGHVDGHATSSQYTGAAHIYNCQCRLINKTLYRATVITSGPIRVSTWICLQAWKNTPKLYDLNFD